MSKSESYNTELYHCKNSINYANKMLEDITGSIKQLEIVDDDMQKYFSIGCLGVYSNKINGIKQSLNNIKKGLSDDIIPSLKKQINELTNKINEMKE